MVLNSVARSLVSGFGRVTRPVLRLLRTQLRCQVLAEVAGFEHRADLDLFAPLAEWRAPDPLDRFLDRLHLPQPEPRDQLLALGEGPVQHGAVAATEPDPH